MAELVAKYCKSWIISSNIWAPFFGCCSALEGLCLQGPGTTSFQKLSEKTLAQLVLQVKSEEGLGIHKEYEENND